MPVFRDESDEDDLYESVSRMADRMGLQGEKRETYIDDHMLQGGYSRVQSRESYAKVQQEGEGDQGSGNRWGFGKHGPGQGQGGNQGGRNSADGDRF